MLKKMIWVTFQRKGFHKFPRAESDASLQDVKYLASVHRHLFKFKVSIEVFSNDREIEFHQFLNWLEDLYEHTLTLDFKSCEMIAEDLLNTIGNRYPNRRIVVDVSEDGECGSIVEKV